MERSTHRLSSLSSCLRFASWLALMGGLQGCDFDLSHILDVPPPDCKALARGPWKVDLQGDDLRVGDSRRGSVTPGLPVECADRLTAVTWSVRDPAIASIAQGRRNASNDTAGDVSRAWITGLRPGHTTIEARLAFSDGVDQEAQPAALAIVEGDTQSPRSSVVAEGEVSISMNRYTGAGGSGPIPVAVPAAGRLDITVDWDIVGNLASFQLWQGTCSADPCSGPLVVNEPYLTPTKPRRESVDDVAPGRYTLQIGMVGSGSDTARYEVLLTPN
jgi:hypothetical protein